MRMESVAHLKIPSGGISLHAASLGPAQGPLVVMCHGMPGLWYSWRHQMVALAAAGYHAVAIDQRGFGQSDRPIEVHEYTSLHTVADVIAVLDHFEAEQAVLIGIDFGAAQVYNCAIRHPERVKAVIGMACPYDFDFSGRGCAGSAPVDPASIERIFARPDMSPKQCFAAIAEHQFFYAHYYQTIGVAEREFSTKPMEFLRKLFWNLSADGKLLDPAHWPEDPQGYCEVLSEPDQDLPWSWMTSQDLDTYVKEFCAAPKGSEFIGGINLYRAAEENWHINAQYCDENVKQPSLFIAGSEDPVLEMIDENALQAFQARSDDLRGIIIVGNAGHFVPMEQPEETNRHILDFLETLS